MPTEWPIPMTAEALIAELAKLRDCFALTAQEPARSARCKPGTGGWWELSGYALVLEIAMTRIRNHRRRVEGIDRQVAKELAGREEPDAE